MVGFFYLLLTMTLLRNSLALLFILSGFLEVSAQNKKVVVQLNYRNAETHLQPGKIYPVDKGGTIMIPASESVVKQKEVLSQRNQQEEVTRNELETQKATIRREDQ